MVSNSFSRMELNVMFPDGRDCHIHSLVFQVCLKHCHNELNDSGCGGHHGFNHPFIAKLTEMAPPAGVVPLCPFSDVETEEISILFIRHISATQVLCLALMCTAISG